MNLNQIKTKNIRTVEIAQKKLSQEVAHLTCVQIEFIVERMHTFNGQIRKELRWPFR